MEGTQTLVSGIKKPENRKIADFRLQPGIRAQKRGQCESGKAISTGLSEPVSLSEHAQSRLQSCISARAFKISELRKVVPISEQDGHFHNLYRKQPIMHTSSIGRCSWRPARKPDACNAGDSCRKAVQGSARTIAWHDISGSRNGFSTGIGTDTAAWIVDTNCI